jgi:hypothetical protein
MDSAELEAREWAKAFRPKHHPLAIAALANLALAGLCFGVPYYRGHAHAETSMHAFARFAGCMFGAQAEHGLGLGLPPGERDHFAGQVLHASANWPARCQADLRAIAPSEAIFLWPSVKLAGGDLRAVVTLVEREVQTLSRQRQMDAAGHVPSRPLLAISKLRAALALFAHATGADGELDANAVRFDKPALLVTPARLPLVAGSTATLNVWAGEDGLRAVAMDGRGLSWLRVQDGKIDHQRVKRTSLVRAALRAGDDPWIVWAMAKDRCAVADDHCLHRATGIARFEAGAAQLPVPVWLGGHPADRADRSVRVALGNRVDLLALLDANGGFEIRRFELPQVAAEDAPPHAALERYTLPSDKPPISSLLLPGQPAAVAYAVAEDGGAHAWLWSYDEKAAPNQAPPRSAGAVPPIDLGAVAGEGAWLTACDTGGARWVAFGTRSSLAITRVGADSSTSPVQAATPIALGDPLHAEDAARDRVRLLCTEGQATAVAATADNTLVALRCDATHCRTSAALADDIAAFDAASTSDGATLIAYAQHARPQLVVARLDATADQLDTAQTPAACWDPEGGMCGQPTLVADSGRLLLCARDGSDLLAIESEDAGRTWKSMSGLQVSNAAPTDIDAPMRQHRLRKGLD